MCQNIDLQFLLFYYLLMLVFFFIFIRALSSFLCFNFLLPPHPFSIWFFIALPLFYTFVFVYVFQLCHQHGSGEWVDSGT
jgi:hypothetical protein